MEIRGVAGITDIAEKTGIGVRRWSCGGELHTD
jgi:hypothetical protein